MQSESRPARRADLRTLLSCLPQTMRTAHRLPLLQPVIESRVRPCPHRGGATPECRDDPPPGGFAQLSEIVCATDTCARRQRVTRPLVESGPTGAQLVGSFRCPGPFGTGKLIHLGKKGFASMRFLVVGVGDEAPPLEPDTLLLRPVGWNDWWTWKTMFRLSTLNRRGKVVDIGLLKVANLATEYKRDDSTGGSRTELPKRFSRHPQDVVSLGQDETYYSELRKALGPVRMKEALRLIGDLALEPQRFERVRHEPVVSRSLLRSVPPASVTGLFARIIRTGQAQISYEFKYLKPSENPEVTEPLALDFSVVPNSKPPTNVHVLIGRNGSGKTTIMRSMVNALLHDDAEDGWFVPPKRELGIANVVFVSFSAFDPATVPVEDIPAVELPYSYSYVGLQYTGAKDEAKGDETVMPTRPQKRRIGTRSVGELTREFTDSALVVARGASNEIWRAALKNLESDPNFNDAGVAELADLPLKDTSDLPHFRARARRLYGRLSSGHKIVLLTVTRLVQTVTEKTLVLLDEPEGHLHPPLLSAFIRSLSELMKTRNGIAIVATHSPVILQEVPSSAAWRISRTGKVQTASRLDRQTFGENVGVLTDAVFGLEVTKSGFHQTLIEAAKRLGDYDAVVEEFGNELGFEARAALRAWLATQPLHAG